MEPTTKELYLVEYDAFMASYKRSEVSGEEVGEVIARLAQHFAFFNMQMVSNDRKQSAVAKDIESRADENGKAISSSKAAIFLSATPEAHEYRTSRAHVQNIECFINALKALQKGVLNEMSHMGLT